MNKSAQSYKYSVLMCVYMNDNPDHLEVAMRSMANQTLKADEFIVVKDGPISKELQHVIDEYKGLFRLHQIQIKHNVGLGKALNIGLMRAKNELIARMDADDYSLPDRCKLEMLEFVNNCELDICGCQVEEFEGDIDNIVGQRFVPTENKKIHEYVRYRDPFNHPSVMYKKKSVLAVGGYRSYRKNQDTDLWIRMLGEGMNGKNLEGVYLRFRFDKDTYLKRKSWINTKTLIKIRFWSWKNGYNRLFEMIVVIVGQLLIFLLPLKFQKKFYERVLRPHSKA